MLVLGSRGSGFSSVMSLRWREGWSIRDGKNGPSPGKEGVRLAGEVIVQPEGSKVCGSYIAKALLNL